MGSSSDSSATTDSNHVITLDELKGFYVSAQGQSVTAADIVRVLDVVIPAISSEDSSATDLNTALIALRDLVVVNTKEIEYLHRLIGLLTLEFVNQGFEIGNKELLKELNKL